MGRKKDDIAEVPNKKRKSAMALAKDTADKVKQAALKKRAAADSSADELEGGRGSDASTAGSSSSDDDEEQRKLDATTKRDAKELDDLHSIKSDIQKKIDDTKNVNQAKLKELRETRNSFSSDITVCDLFIKIFFSHTN